MIELKNITKEYKTSAGTVHALKGVSLSFRENEFVAILGPSGGGKTTLLNIIGGLDRYTNGDLVINGRSTKKYCNKDWDTYRNHSVGFIFQSYNLIPHQTVLANVELALTIAGISKNERKNRAIQVLEKVGLADQIEKNPNQLSGGQMQRVAIARALINDPDILLADEPTGALDSVTSVQIMDLLKEVAKDKLVVMVTHNPDLAYQYANRIVKLTDGEIIDDSNPLIENETKSHRKNKRGYAKMHFTTALSLSLQNLWTKKARTLLVGFAGSIGIIGIALILALSTGVNTYIDMIQENSLSSYPLMIENNNIDITSIMNSLMGSLSSKEQTEGVVTEIQVLNEMFSSNAVGSNNLKKFKKFIEENDEIVKQWVSSIQYDYGFDMNIYLKDTSNGVIKVNPSPLMENKWLSLYSQYSYTESFYEMVENSSLIENQYDVLVGRWASNYDEVTIVLGDKYAISDYTLYSLGLKDNKEFNELIYSIMNAEMKGVESEIIKLTYEELMDIEYQVIIPASQYAYDETYNVWIDKSDDEEFMKKVVENGLSLKIVGIVAPKKGNDMITLMPGVCYTHGLVEWSIEQSKKTEIVKEQLANSKVDVFTGKTFEEINNSTKNLGIDFASLVTIDEEALASVFGGSAIEKNITKIATDTITKTINSIVINNNDLKADLLTDLSTKALDMVTKYIRNNGNGTSAQYSKSEISTIVSNYLATANINSILNKYGMERSYYIQLYQGVLEGLLTGYYTASATLTQGKAILTRAGFASYLAIAMQTNDVQNGVQMFADEICAGKIKLNVANAMGTLAKNVATTIAESINVDADLLSKAIKLNMDEAELSRLLTTLAFSTSSDVASSDANLRGLGYADTDEPTTINVYLYDFESKDAFKNFIDEYNEACEELGNSEDMITFTDYTGVIMTSVQKIIKAISYILIAFVSVSLVVSSIMIGIITYISVIERTKEIGILRAIGASKKDVGNIFSAETFIIGLLAGGLGVSVSYLLLIGINALIYYKTKIVDLKAILDGKYALYLIIISVILTLIAGILPSRKASKCDPVIALRSE